MNTVNDERTVMMKIRIRMLIVIFEIARLWLTF